MDIIETFEPLLCAISDGRRAFKAANDGKQPSSMYCSPEAFFYLQTNIVNQWEERLIPPIKVHAFQADPLEVHIDKALKGLELKFT